MKRSIGIFTLFEFGKEYGNKLYIWLIILMEALYAIRDIGGVISLAYALDQIVTGQNLLYALLAMSLFMLGGVPIAYFRRKYRELFALDLQVSLMKKFQTAIIQKNIAELNKKHSGELLNLFTDDINKMVDWYKRTFPEIVTLAIYIPVAFVYFFSQNVTLTIFVIPIVVLVIPLILSLSSRLQDIVKSERIKSDEIIIKANEFISDLEFIKAYNLEEYTERQLKNLYDDKLSITLRISKLEVIIKALSILCSYLPGVITTIIGGIYLIYGKITIGFLIAFVQMVMGRFSYIFPQISDFATNSNKAIMYSERILSFISEGFEQSTGIEKISKNPKVLIKVNRLTFSYDGNQDVLRDISFEVTAGQKIALVGSSGCGKSTIIKLIMGFYKVDNSKIFLGDSDICNLSADDIRKYFSPVFQNSFLFSGTVENNLRMLAPEIKRHELSTLVESIGLPDNFLKHSVGQNGAGLSGGQKQRIAIAKSIIKNAPVFILDEPMSALDNVTEKKISSLLDVMLENKTVIAVSHRLLSIINYDKILFIENGSIVESGTHEELMLIKGKYFQMYEAQQKEGASNE